MESKCCKKCKETKPITSFGKRKDSKDGLAYWCYSCKRTNANKWQKANPELRKNHQHNAYKKYYSKNKPKVLENINTYQTSIPPGVYAGFSNGVCLYVGESIKPQRRWNDHRTFLNNPELCSSGRNKYYKMKNHSNIIFGILEFTDNHKEREEYWINKLKPLYNDNK